MAKAKSRSKHSKKEMEEAKKEAKVACLAVTAAGDAKARVEDDLAQVLDALAATEEDGRRSKVEIAHLEVERTSLLLKLEASKDEVSSLHS